MGNSFSRQCRQMDRSPPKGDRPARRPNPRPPSRYATPLFHEEQRNASSAKEDTKILLADPPESFCFFFLLVFCEYSDSLASEWRRVASGGVGLLSAYRIFSSLVSLVLAWRSCFHGSFPSLRSIGPGSFLLTIWPMILSPFLRLRRDHIFFLP